MKIDFHLPCLVLVTGLILFSGNGAIAGQYPVDLVKTSQSLYIHGSPKTLTENDGKGYILSFRFDPDGVLIENSTSGPGAGRIKIELHKKGSTIIGKDEYATGPNVPNKITRHTKIVVRKYDKRGRAILYSTQRMMKSGRHTTRSRSLMVTEIKYTDDAEIYDSYINSNNGISKVSTLTYSFSNDHNLEKICLKIHGNPMLEPMNECKIYSAYGLLKDNQAHKYTTYHYTNGQLDSQTLYQLNPVNGKYVELYSVVYSDYVVDKCGNWIKRKLSLKPFIKPGDTCHLLSKQQGGHAKCESHDMPPPLEATRTITYYRECQ